MKKSLKIILVSFLIGSQSMLMAQTDIKLNVSNALLYEFNVMYEYALSDNASISGFGGYQYGFPGTENTAKYWYIGPEVRYYVGPDEGADRFYFGGYMRYKGGYTSGTIQEEGILLSDGNYGSYGQRVDANYDKLAIGFCLGSKWVTRDGFVFGVFGGIGRNIVSSYQNSNELSSHQDEFVPETYYVNYNSEGVDSEYWDFRIGFNIGWRFD